MKKLLISFNSGNKLLLSTKIMLKKLTYFLIAFLLVSSCASDAPIAITGNISGSVKESSGPEPISGVTIALSGESTQSTVSGSSGNFNFNNIIAGSYVVTASKTGYVTDAKPSIVNPEKTSSISFSLVKRLPSVNPNSIELTLEKTEESLELTNNQDGVMNFTTSTSQNWLTVSPSTGSIQTNNTKIIKVTADFTTLSPGTYEEKMVINVEGSTLSVPVKVTYVEAPYITVTKPKEDEVYKMGESMPIAWDSNLDGKVKIELSRASAVQLTIATETENKEGGSYDWAIPGMESEYYKLVVTSKENPEISFTTQPFKIDPGATKPVVTTAESVKETGINFIKVEGTIVSLGVLATQLDQHGHVYSINNKTPTVADNRTKYGVLTETKTYTSDITSLQSAETYYLRAYATNSKGTSYGEIITATTKSGGPILSTTDASDITKVSAKSGGNVTSDGGSTLTERGLFYGTTEELNADSSKIKDSGTSTGTFTSSLTGLTKGTKYFIMAYAKNSSGYGYGKIKSFNTVGDPPTVETTAVDKISGTKAEASGKVTSNGGESLSSYGFAYGKSSSPSIEDNKWEVGTKDVEDEFKGLISGLDTSTKYYVRAYATNVRGTSYGVNKDFTTTNGLPGVTTVSTDSINGNSAFIKGKIDDNGGSATTSYGFAYAETANPTIDGFKIEVGTDGSGEYGGKIKSLKKSTKYYVKAYATNANGTSYGEQLNFTTTDGMPKVNTVGSRDIVGTKATATGTIIDNGGEALTSYGFVYSTDQNPTISGTKLEVGKDTTGGYSGLITGLNTETKYYYRAYATNSAGSAYGSELSFTTLDGMPKASTTEIKDIEVTTAKVVGKIDSDGGETIEEYGFVYSTEQNPIITGNKLVVKENTDNVFEGTISNLTRLTKYYVRAFITNTAGTAYGNELDFTTKDGPYFTITAPNLNQNISIGKTFNITWDTNKTEGDLTIEHWNGNIKTELSNSTPVSAKSFAWGIAEDAATGSDNTIKFTENNDTTLTYESPKFTLSALTYVPDDAFEQYLIDNGWDDKLDDYVLTSNIASVEEIILAGKVADITGVGDFVGLKKFEINIGGSISTKNIDLSNLIKLKEIKIIMQGGFSSLNSFVFPDSSELENVYISPSNLNSSISSIDLSKNTGLKRFYFNSFSKIKNYDFSKNINLESLTLFSLEDLETLDVSKNTKLTNIELNGSAGTGTNNNYKSIDLSNNTALNRIYITYFGLENIDVSMLGDVEYVILDNNADLRCIKVTQSQYDNIPSKGQKWRKPSTAIYSTDCNLTYVPDDTFERILIYYGYDDVEDNYVKTANIKDVTTLEGGYTGMGSGIFITDPTGIEDFINLTTLNWNSVKITSLDLSALTSLEKIVVKSAYVTSNQLYLNPTLTSIILPDTDTLKELDLTNNALSSIDVSKFSNLEVLFFGLTATISQDNRSSMPKTLDLTSNKKLKRLQAWTGNFESIDISGITSIEQLILQNNYLTSLDVSELTDLSQLWVTGNEKLYCIKVTEAQRDSGTLTVSKDNHQQLRLECYNWSYVVGPDTYNINNTSYGLSPVDVNIGSDGSIYVVTSRYLAPNNQSGKDLVIKSDDNGVSWSKYIGNITSESGANNAAVRPYKVFVTNQSTYLIATILGKIDGKEYGSFSGIQNSYEAVVLKKKNSESDEDWKVIYDYEDDEEYRPSPRDLSVFSDGSNETVYIAGGSGSKDSRIFKKKNDDDLELVLEQDSSSNIRAVHVTKDETLYYTHQSKGVLKKGKDEDSWSTVYDENLQDLQDVFVGDDNTVYISTGKSVIKKKSGSEVWETVSNDTVTGIGELDNPNSIFVTSDNTIYISSTFGASNFNGVTKVIKSNN